MQAQLPRSGCRGREVFNTLSLNNYFFLRELRVFVVSKNAQHPVCSLTEKSRPVLLPLCLPRQPTLHKAVAPPDLTAPKFVSKQNGEGERYAERKLEPTYRRGTEKGL